PEFRARTWEAAWRAAGDGRPPAGGAGAPGVTVGGVYSAQSRGLARPRGLFDGQLGDRPGDPAKTLWRRSPPPLRRVTAASRNRSGTSWPRPHPPANSGTPAVRLDE